MGELTVLIEAIPQAAHSPLALTAYLIFIAAWSLSVWLRSKPQVDAKRALKLYKDDRQRNIALKAIIGKPPPEGLNGNEAILAWVKSESADKARVLLLIAWLATLISAVVLVVAIINTPKPVVGHPIAISLYRYGTSNDCPSLSSDTRLQVLDFSGGLIDSVPVRDCRATYNITVGAHIGNVHLSLINAAPYAVHDPGATYDLIDNDWSVMVSSPEDSLHLRISLFANEGMCTQGASANDTFRSILESKAAFLRGLFPTGDARYDYLTNVRVLPAGRTLNRTVAEVHNYWLQSGSLEVLSSVCFQKAGQEIMRSQIYFGPLAGPAPEPFIAELALDANEFGTVRDIHTAAILFALGEEGLARRLAGEVVIPYFENARAVAMQLNPGDTRNSLLLAIDQSLKSAGAPEPNSW